MRNQFVAVQYQKVSSSVVVVLVCGLFEGGNGKGKDLASLCECVSEAALQQL